jgi:hypothetical protein
MSKFKTFQKTMATGMLRSGLKLKKAQPAIMLGLGIAGVLTSTVLACRATLKATEILDAANEDLAAVKKAKETVDIEVYSDNDYKKDLAITYAKTAFNFTKLYGPAVILGAASVYCLIGSHNIMKQRNIAVMAAYKAIEGSFKTYRGRVVEEFGIEKDRQFRTGVRMIEGVVPAYKDEDGVKHKEQKIEIETVDANDISQYARFFDESSKEWEKDPEYNLFFLKCQQNSANDRLKARGHLFLNEVYDMLGMQRSKAGAAVGWVMGNGDGFVDFGLFNGQRPIVRDFVNGYERSVLLDFNVDGIIWDLI